MAMQLMRSCVARWRKARTVVTASHRHVATTSVTWFGSVLLLSLSSMASIAAEAPPTGFYLGAGIGNATLTLEDTNSFADFEDDDVGFRLIAGYRLFRFFGIEAGYSDYGRQEDRVLGVDLEGDFYSVHAAAVGLIPLGMFDLFGKAGIAYWEGSLERVTTRFEAAEDNVDPIIAFGAQFRVGQFALRAEVEGLLLGFDDDGDEEADGDDFVNFVSLSATWSF